MEEASKIQDEELFTSQEFQSYMTDKIEAIGKRYQRPLKVTIYADEQDETVAFTDYAGIYVNAANEITRSFPSRKLRALSIEGLCSHENGHNLFTDYIVWKAHMGRLKKGRFYPRKPSGLDSVQKQYAESLLTALQDKQDPVPAMVILQTAKALENILEDGYIDTRYSCEFPGLPARGIALNNMRFAESVPDITEMIQKKFYDHNIVLNLLIQYVRAGEVNNLSGYQGDLLQAVEKCIPIIDECLFDDDARNRCRAVNRILIDLWPMMEKCFDSLRDLHQQAEQQAQQDAATGTDQDSATSGNCNDQVGHQQGESAVEAALSEQLPKNPPNFNGNTESVLEGETGPQDHDACEKARNQAIRVFEEETNRIALQHSERSSTGQDGKVAFNGEYEGAGYDAAGDDVQRLLESMAEHKVQTRMEEELSEELQREANNIEYGNIHRGIGITVNRMAQVDQSLIDAYEQVAPALLPISRRLQQRVRPLIEEKRQGGRQTGLYCGKRLYQKALFRDDGRWFTNMNLPSEPISMRVALVVDESGSMCGLDRITRARAAAIVVHDFCVSMGIPALILGHTALDKRVSVFSYADFDSVDKNDRYRLMDMSARECNRDGAVIRFAAERLNRETADVKLMLIITDGQPNDDGYSGTAAEADLRGIKQEYSRKGIKMYAAAIGDDRENIERIYGSGFLDMTDLNELPMKLTALIARSIPL